ncbi:MAG: histidine kinase [Nocardioides sp.]
MRASTARPDETAAIAAAAVLLSTVPWVVIGVPSSTVEWANTACLLASGLTFLAWRRHPVVTLSVGGTLLVTATALGVDRASSAAFVLGAALGLLAGLGFRGRSAWPGAAGFAVLLALLYLVTGEQSVGLAMLTVPVFLAGTAFRLRRQTADELGLRARELTEERELFAHLAVRNERARIAAELHDIVGHSLSVMVVQAQAGQRLLASDPGRARDSIEAIAESARQGEADLRRLIALLGGADVARPDLTLIQEVVDRASRSGLHVTCRFEGDHPDTSPAAGQLAFRVVQEALTNALRYAPGSAVRVLVRSEGHALVVRVSNDPPQQPTAGIIGTGRGLAGLRERVQEIGGTLVAGLAPAGGWAVEARLPQASPA